jgi:hypothetical protein
VVVFGLVSMVVAAGAGSWVAWENRHAIVRMHVVGDVFWTGHLSGLLVVGALLACWFMLGVAFVRCRIAERRQAPSAAPATEPEQPRRPAPGQTAPRQGRGECDTILQR